MEKPSSYCEYVNTLPEGNIHRIYHDTQYGFPIDSDNELFGRLILEINQSGLSWTTILNKQDNFRKAFSNFDIRKIAGYNDKDTARLLSDAGIIRNKLKINAVIYNACKILEIQEENGSFKNWLDSQPRMELKELGKTVQKAFQVHRRRNHQRVSDEHGISARGPCRIMSNL